MVAFDATGNVRWVVPNETPQIATADGGFIGQSGITYDQNGNATGQGNLYTQSWTGNMYQVGSIDQFYVFPILLATSFWAFEQANNSGNSTAALPLPDRVKAIYDIVGPDPLGAGAVLRSINYILYQGLNTFAPSKNAVIQEKLIYSYDQKPSPSQSAPGKEFDDEVGTRGQGPFGLTQQFLARVPGSRHYRIQIEPCTATNTWGTAVWQNIIIATLQTVSINNNAGSTQGSTCHQ